MSVKIQIELRKGISGPFICRVESVQVRNKPEEIKKTIATVAWYADETEKAANRPIIEPQSIDLPVESFLGDVNPIEAAYTYLKQPGQMLNGGTDC